MTTYSSPPLDAKGLAARTGLSWNGHKWGNNSGQTWNTHVSYAIGLGDDGSLRAELHDTPNDHGLTDPSFKRRAEIGSADTFRNGVDYWYAYDFEPDIEILPSGLSLRTSQVHWPSGASPAIGDTILVLKGALNFRVTRKTDTSNSITMATVLCANRQKHRVVRHFKLGANGFLKVWFDGKQIVDFTGPVGSAKEDGYSNRHGLYGVLKGAKAVIVVSNMAAFPSSSDLSARIASPIL